MAYALMPNHFHFLIEQIGEFGVTEFMHRLGTSYTKYFNRRYDRSGRLFESEYKVVPIQSDAHLYHISRYIHLNPLSLSPASHKLKRCAEDWKRAEEFLLRYPWSSYRSYVDRCTDEVNPDMIWDMFCGSTDYRAYMREWYLSPQFGSSASKLSFRPGMGQFLPNNRYNLQRNDFSAYPMAPS